MKIYVATKFTNYQVARDAIRVLRQNGHSITYDWTKHVDEGESDKVLCATEDMNGVCRADAVILFAVEGMAGAWIELGAALARNKPVFIIGAVDRMPIFVHHPLVRQLDSLDDVLELCRGS